MASERTDELYKVLLDRGYPKEFCAEIAYKNMNTDYTQPGCWDICTGWQILGLKTWWMRCWRS